MADQLTITLPDGSTRAYPTGVQADTIARDISEGLARKTLAAKVNGEVVETTRPIQQDAEVQLLTWQDLEGKSTFWHSSAHLMAEALEALYPGVKLGIGPPIEQGFYYDVDFGEHTFGPEDFAKVEKKFLELARSGETFVRKEISKADALKYFQDKGDEYKLDLIKDLEDGQITFYESGAFVDLCKGPHINTSKHVKAVKLLSIAGAYWRGDSNNKQLTRIYAISFPSQKELDEYLQLLEEAQKRDHRKLGKELGLFLFEQEGPGFPFWMDKGMRIFNGLKDYLRGKLDRLGYAEIQTPIILNEQLWHQSGHWQNYQENMYFTEIDEENFAVKPMNCPGSTFIYRAQPRSYRDLPVRLSEFGMVHRHELSGVLHGLFRVRAFTQDDAHVFCLPDQVEDELVTLINLIFEVYRDFGFQDIRVKLSTRPEDKYIGSLEVWNYAEEALKQALARCDIEYQLNAGDGAFYGPKIDFKVRDSLQRDWQLGTIQLDFSMPERFDLNYKGTDGELHRPVMIHRAVLGSFERFIGILLEHTAGKLPLWLAPVQVAVLPVSDKVRDYAEHVAAELKAHKLRAELDVRNEKIGKKIRDAELQKIPFMLILGERESQERTVSIRQQGVGDQGAMALAEFLPYFAQQIQLSTQPQAEPTAV